MVILDILRQFGLFYRDRYKQLVKARKDSKHAACVQEDIKMQDSTLVYDHSIYHPRIGSRAVRGQSCFNLPNNSIVHLQFFKSLQDPLIPMQVARVRITNHA